MMKEVLNQLQRMETKFLEWAEAYSYSILRVGIGIVIPCLVPSNSSPTAARC